MEVEDESAIKLQISIDAKRLSYLLENRLLFVEELKSCNGQSKSQVKHLLLRNALKR